jgi:hypothetical protein
MRDGKVATMPSYFLPYPKGKSQRGIKHKPSPLQTEKAKQPYPHPQPDPPNNPPSPLNLSSPSSSLSASSSSSSSSSTIRPTPPTRHNDYNPSSLNLQLVFGNPHDPSLVVVFGLKFREGRRPKVKFSVKRGHGRSRELGDVLGVGSEGEGKTRGGEDRARGGEDRARDGEGRSRGKKRKRDGEN